MEREIVLAIVSLANASLLGLQLWLHGRTQRMLDEGHRLRAEMQGFIDNMERNEDHP